MTVASPSRRQWWQRLPPSWIAMAPPGDGRERDLDETAALRRRWDDPPPPPAPKIQVPIGVVVTLAIYLVGQLVAGVWWAATLQSDVRYMQTKNGELWQLLETQRLKTENLEKKFDENVRAKVREILDDYGYLRVRGRKEE